jgi:hypothetical protein
MSLEAMHEYSPFFMEGWQYKAGFCYPNSALQLRDDGIITVIDNLLEKPIE